VKPEGAVFTGELLLALPGSRAQIDSKNGAVRLSLAGTWPAAASPWLESAIVLHAGKGCDLDLTLDRGRVFIQNQKRQGSARVCVRFQDQKWDLTLDEPGAKIALESFGRWVAPPRVFDKASKGKKPEVAVVLLVLQGEAGIKTGINEYALQAPPGAALYSWRSATGNQGPTSLKELPTWARKTKPAEDKQSKAARAAVADLRRSLAEKPVRSTLAKALRAQKEARRELAVYCLGAVDDVSGVLNGLENEDHADVRQAAIKELRHWASRGEAYPVQLYQALLKRKFSRGQAAIAMELLFGFSPAQLAQPETYALLIEYLKHRRVAIRELAHRQLVLLVPDGRSIPYDAAGNAKQLDKAYAAWKQRIPDGEVPSERKPEKKK
jgi:hypothetical protein